MFQWLVTLTLDLLILGLIVENFCVKFDDPIAESVFWDIVRKNRQTHRWTEVWTLPCDTAVDVGNDSQTNYVLYTVA